MIWWPHRRGVVASMSYNCPDCGSDTRVHETRGSLLSGTPSIVRRLASDWGGREESWVCRRRHCTNHDCKHRFWTAEMEIDALKALAGEPVVEQIDSDG